MTRSLSFALLWCSLVAAAEAPVSPMPPESPWPQFRGPGGQGHVQGKVPREWSEGQNIAWKTPLPGKGWSSPVVADGKVWVTTAVPVKEKELSFRVIGIDLKTGDVKHDVELFHVAKPAEVHPRNNHASPSPAVVGHHLVASFGSDGLGCIDTLIGQVVWRREDLKVNYASGPGSSPVPYQDFVILPCDGADSQFVIALEAATGKERWRTERPAAASKMPAERRAFCTPLVFTHNGKDQVVIPGAHCVYSYDPLTGKELWRVTYKGFSNVPRPLYAHGHVYISTGYFAHELLAIRPDGSGDVTDSHVAWRVKKGVPSVPSPILVGDWIFMVNDTGSATCLDARTGAVKWTERLPGKYTASPLVAGNVIHVFSDEGKAILFKAASTFEEVGRNDLQGRIQATPSVVKGCWLIRTDSAIYKVKEGS